MNKYIAVHFHEFVVSAKEFDTLADAQSHLLFKSSLLNLGKWDLMAVYRAADGELVGTVPSISYKKEKPGKTGLSKFLQRLF